MNFRSAISILLIGVVLYCPQACLAESLAAGDTSVKKTCSCSRCAKQESPPSPGHRDGDPDGCGCDCLCKGAIIDSTQCVVADYDFSLPAIDGNTRVVRDAVPSPHASRRSPITFPPLASALEICALLVSLQL